MPRCDVTVVVVNYNVRSFLDHCLQSLKRASQGLQVQIIVVDNASRDNSAEMVAERYPEVLLLVNRENAGFARANNQAFVQAAGEAVLIINPDSFVQEDTLRVLLEVLRQHPQVGAVGPKILLPDGRYEPRSMRGFPTPWAAFAYLSGLSALFPRSPLFSRYLLTYLDPEREHSVDALSGCCLMVRRDLLVELEGFDGDYFMYGEDLDLCFRIRRRGYQILYTPATRILHFKGESTRRSDIDQEYHFRRAMRLFVEKNLSGQTSALARQVISLGFLLQGVEKRLSGFLLPLFFPVVDIIILNLLIYLGRWARFSSPAYSASVWLANGIYSLFFLISGSLLGIYTGKRLSGRYALYAAGAAGLAASALTYFVPRWAFSRFVVLWFSCSMALAMPAWRILFRRWVVKRNAVRGRNWARRRALIVGTDESAAQISQQLRRDPAGELEPVGLVAFSEDDVGRVIEGVPVLGTVAELERLIQTERIQEVLITTSQATYDRIIGLIQNLSYRSLNFRVNTQEPKTGGVSQPLLHLQLKPPRCRAKSRSESRGIFRQK